MWSLLTREKNNQMKSGGCIYYEGRSPHRIYRVTITFMDTNRIWKNSLLFRYKSLIIHNNSYSMHNLKQTLKTSGPTFLLTLLSCRTQLALWASCLWSRSARYVGLLTNGYFHNLAGGILNACILKFELEKLFEILVLKNVAFSIQAYSYCSFIHSFIHFFLPFIGFS